ncbi:unnamed protein product [Leuciscus chuanchicus]
MKNNDAAKQLFSGSQFLPMHQSSSSSTKPVTTIRAKPPSRQDESAKPSLERSPPSKIMFLSRSAPASVLRQIPAQSTELSQESTQTPEICYKSAPALELSPESFTDAILSTTVSPAQKRRLRRKKWFSPECPEGYIQSRVTSELISQESLLLSSALSVMATAIYVCLGCTHLTSFQ